MVAKKKQQRKSGGVGGISWYLKYRPKTLSELDQEDVKHTLLQFVQKGQIPHALLFAGPKGTGKTSSARIIAKILNCEKNPEGTLSGPCNKCDSCQSINNGTSLSVIELDGASNRGIEDIRAIREAAKLSVPGRFRVYIIDEAHMLTLEAANALLKTLEEPPAHVVFILATTDYPRLPETIRSRATTINFKRATHEELVRALGRVIKGEGLDIDRDTLSDIPKVADGSFRDAIKILEQAVQNDKNWLKTLVNVSPDNLLVSLGEGDMKEAVSEIGRVWGSGVSMGTYVVSIIERLREVLMFRIGVNRDVVDIPELKDIADIKRLIELFSDASRFINLAPIPTISLEMVVVEWCTRGREVGSHPARSSSNSTTAQGGTSSRGLRADKSGDFVPLEPVSNSDDLRSQKVSPPSRGGEVNEEVWKRILDGTRAKNHTIAALLRSAQPTGINGGKMQVLVFYEFHKDRLEDSRNKVIVEEVIQELIGPVGVEFILGEKPKGKDIKIQKHEDIKDQDGVTRPTTNDEDIEKIAQEIFGRKLEN